MRSIEATEKRVAIDGIDTKSENYKGSGSCSMSDEDVVICFIMFYLFSFP